MILYIDISNFVDTRSHTGIQRVLREFLYRLLQKPHTVDFKVIFYNESRNLFAIIEQEELSIFLDDTKNHIFSENLIHIDIAHIESGDIFFDMDGVWNNSLKRPFLYKELHAHDVKIINFIYDLVPIKLPQYSHYNTIRNFVTFLYAVYQYSDMVFFDSRSAEKDFLTFKTKINNPRNISTRVVKLGSDISTKVEVFNSKYTYLLQKKYILFVGTLEPRKNQTLILDVFEELSSKYPDLHLIFVGKEGWNNHTLIRRIEKHTLLDKSLFWLQDIDDNTLLSLYEHAFLCVYISAYEGFGLPVAESLSYGNITITSKNSSMYEVGKNFADYLVYNSFSELYETIETYLEDDILYAHKKDFIKNNYVPYSWDLTFDSVINVFENLQTCQAVTTPEKLQFVFISIDPSNMEGTIDALDTYVDFISNYIIVTRANLISEFEKIKTKYTLHIIDESTILGKYIVDFQDKDHQSKNWLLRASLLNLDILEDQFIMLDDDNRPVQNIPLSHFIADGKYNAYYFYDLLEWHNEESAYDKGQKSTREILDKSGFELLSYASHKPQIIDKTLFKEVIEHYFEHGLHTPIDEWSIYFNYAISNYPFLFQKTIFDTLNWPANPSDWDWYYIPEKFYFENYYPLSYTDGVFKTLAKDDLSEKLTIKEKQIAPYMQNMQLSQNVRPYYKALNLVHGLLKFSHKKSMFYCYGLPYYIEAAQGSWYKILLNCKYYGFKDAKVQLGYWINNQEGALTNIVYSTDTYHENIISFAISCTSLKKQKYTLLIDLFIDGEPLYNTSSPYMVELYIK